MSNATFFPRSVLASVVLALAALLAAVSPGDTTPNAPTSDPPETTPGPKKGDPVGIIDGSVYASVVDLRIPCPGVDLVLKRAYGSWTTRTTALGYGWSHSLDWRLVRSGDGKNLVLYADADPASAGTGETHRFEELDEAGKTSISPSGGFVLSRVRGSLTGDYEVQTPGALLYRFSSEGVLLKILTPGGIGIRMERDVRGRLLRAVHDCGQSLTFSYDEEGRLTSVETLDPSVRVVYEYADLEGTHAGGLLVRAIRMDHGRASTNRYAWCRLTRAGVVNATPPLSPPRQETRWAIPARVVDPWTSISLSTHAASTHAAAMGSGGGGTMSAGGIAMAARDAYRAESPDGGGFEMPAGFISDRMTGKVSLVALPSWYQTPYLLSQTDANGLETHYEYERPNDGPSVRCTRTFMTGGLFETRLAHLGGTTVVRRPIAGRMVVESHVCDTRRREVLCLVGDEEVSREYDFAGNVSRVTVANTKTGASLVRAFSYDSLRNVVCEGRAFGGNPTRVRTQVWDERRRVPRYIVTPEGRVREWKERGRNINVYGAGTNDARLVTRMYCTANDRPLAVVLPDGGRIDLSYDAAGYLSSVAASDRPAVSYTHDALGRVASVSRMGPEGARTTSYVRNARGRPLSVVHPDGTSESFAYDGNGTKVVAHVDALGRTDAYRWVLGQPVHASRVVAGTTNVLWSVAHDQQLNVVSLTDPLGRAAETYALDENERIVVVTNLEGQVMTRNYLVSDLVASATRFDGSSIAYGYDARANLASVAYPDDTLRFGYDRDGLVTSASNAAGTVTNVHDAATGWLDVSRGADGTEVSYRHSDGGAVTSVTTVAGTTAYALDLAGRRTRIDSPCGTLVVDHCPWNGLVSAFTNANGTSTTYAYDVMNRVTNISWRTASGARLGGFAYRYDTLDRIVSRAHDLGGASFDRAYAYDDLDRLAADGGVSYAYDAAGNRMTRTGDGETVAYTLGQGDRLAAWTGGAYEHDAAGCVTRITRGADTWDLAWNGQYQLVSVSTNGVFAESYAYDALGRRVTTTNAEGTERHVYDDSWQVVADLDEDGNVVRSYVWGEGIDKLLAVKVGMRVYAALTDVQGTVWGYADEQGAVVARWTYDAWGNVLTEEIADSAVELRAVRYRFQGREWSAATGLTNFRMRWYDPVTGRWLSKDPIGLSGGLNLYAFCGGDGLNKADLIGCAHIATRPLDAGGGFMQRINNVLSHLNLPGNIDPRHAEIFFDDNDPDAPSHCGYGPSGPHQDNSSVPYNNHGENKYDDKIMREAVKNVSGNSKWQGDKYGFVLHNCQDFVSAVIKEYDRLKR